jgi:hypothetical protein
MNVKKITNRFDNNCAACGETVWAGELALYNPDAELGQKIKHEKCAGKAARECTDSLDKTFRTDETIVEVIVRFADGTEKRIKHV